MVDGGKSPSVAGVAQAMMQKEKEASYCFTLLDLIIAFFMYTVGRNATPNGLTPGSASASPT